VKSLILLTAVLAMAVPATAQSATRITPGGARAEARLNHGVASYYAASLHGRRTASGERYNRHELTAAHRTLPFGTLLRVTDQRTGRAVLVRVNDRGPFIRGRVLDLSNAAAQQLGMHRRGTARITYEVVDPNALPSRQVAAPEDKPEHL
jgi:rare lipoprotein A